MVSKREILQFFSKAATNNVHSNVLAYSGADDKAINGRHKDQMQKPMILIVIDNLLSNKMGLGHHGRIETYYFHAISI